MRVEAGGLVVEAEAQGRIVGVAPRRRPERRLLDELDLGICAVDGRGVRWDRRDVATDADELSVHLHSPELEVVIRHGFGGGWTTRLLIVNLSRHGMVLNPFRLAARPAPGLRIRALAAGARLCWVVQPADGDGPLLAASLQSGAVSGVGLDGFELGTIRLAPGQRYVVQWHWGLHPSARSAALGPGRDVLVTRTVYELGESVLLPDDPDAALVVPRGVAADTVAEPAGREVFTASPGRRRIEVRSSEGDLRLDLGWVLPLTDQLQEWATAVLAGPCTAAGVVAIADLPAAVVLQAALGTGGLAESDQAADALDRLTARLLADPYAHPGALAVLYLLGEHGRSGDDDVLTGALDRLVALLAQAGPPPPGLGLAVLRTALSGAAPGQVAPLVGSALRRAAEPLEGSQISGGAAAELEMLLAVRPLLPGDPAAEHRLQALVRWLGAAVGAGLPGILLDPPPVAEHAHQAAVLRMLPEEGWPEISAAWGTTPSLLAHRVTVEVLDRLAGAEPSPAAAWLALAQRHA